MAPVFTEQARVPGTAPGLGDSSVSSRDAAVCDPGAASLTGCVFVAKYVLEIFAKRVGCSARPVLGNEPSPPGEDA